MIGLCKGGLLYGILDSLFDSSKVNLYNNFIACVLLTLSFIALQYYILPFVKSRITS